MLLTNIKKFNQSYQSLDDQQNDAVKDTKYNLISDEKALSSLSNVNNKLFISQLFEKLEKNEILVLEGIYMKNQSQQSIAASLNLTQAQISRIKTKGFKKIQEYVKNDLAC